MNVQASFVAWFDTPGDARLRGKQTPATDSIVFNVDGSVLGPALIVERQVARPAGLPLQSAVKTKGSVNLDHQGC